MPDLLLEVLSEEIPARMQAGGAQELEKQVCSRLKEARLTFRKPERFATPRRLALLVHGLPAVQPDITVERKGPRVDAPEKAIQGFLKSTGLTLDDCEQRETPKGPVWFAVSHEKGRPTGNLLTDLLPEALAAVSWPKSMRWDESGVRWVRPIRSILCLLDDAVIPFRFGGAESGRTTLGHRFLSSGPLTIEQVRGYETNLQAAKVMLDPAQRGQKIVDHALALAKDADFTLMLDKWLVTENAGLVEWPVVLMGTIDQRFMDLPPEVLHSAMSTHQRYFSLLDGSGRPAPCFVMVANTETTIDDGAVVAGNERVLRARLADAQFFWEQDKNQNLDARLPALDGVVFHARLGSMYEKAKRIEALARTLCIAINDVRPDWEVPADPDHAARAGLLCKADLVTEMVGEFPELQGLMGRYYAEAHAEAPAIWLAIRDHYAPQGPSNQFPTGPVGVAVALADKLDTLAGFFAIDERPTGSKDPFALRRAALGTIFLIVESVPPLRLSLGDAITAALAGYRDTLPEKPGLEATRDALLSFFADRLKVYLRDKGKRHDLVSAVFAVSGEDDLVRLLARVDALARFLGAPDGANLLTAYRRAANILRIEERKDGQVYRGNANKNLLVEAQEHELHQCISNANATAAVMLGGEHFEDVMKIMATLREPVDAFFDRVTVNCEEPEVRRNRLMMLSRIPATLNLVADFSKIEG